MQNTDEKRISLQIKNLNGLKSNGHVGLYKKGLAISNEHHELICDYLEKINYSLQDIRHIMQKDLDRNALICIIAYTCWINESIEELKKSYKQYALKKNSKLLIWRNKMSLSYATLK